MVACQGQEPEPIKTNSQSIAESSVSKQEIFESEIVASIETSESSVISSVEEDTTTVDIENKIVIEAELPFALSETDIANITSQCLSTIKSYIAGNGYVLDGSGDYDQSFSPFPSDTKYPQLSDLTLTSDDSECPIKVIYSPDKYNLHFNFIKVQGNWMLDGVQTFRKETGKEIPPHLPKYSEEELSAFDEYLQLNLDPNWYSRFNVITTGKPKELGYIKAHNDEIVKVINDYPGKKIEITLYETKYSVKELQDIYNQIMQLPIVKDDFSKRPRTYISSIGCYNRDSVEIILMSEWNELSEMLKKYGDRVSISQSGPNPDT